MTAELADVAPAVGPARAAHEPGVARGDAGAIPDDEASTALDEGTDGPRVAGPGEIVVRRAMLDDERMAMGLPAVSPALVEAESYRAETEAEAADPLFHTLYVLDATIHRQALLAEHQGDEALRFARQAVAETDPAVRALLERSAAEHAALGQALQERVVALRARRSEVVDDIISSKNRKE